MEDVVRISQTIVLWSRRISRSAGCCARAVGWACWAAGGARVGACCGRGRGCGGFAHGGVAVAVGGVEPHMCCCPMCAWSVGGMRWR